MSVYNMPSGVPFLRSLVRGLNETYGDDLKDGLILVPTRRAARALADAFVRDAADRGIGAAMLPRLRPLADVNPDEPPFEPGELAGRVTPAIDPVQRRFEIAQLVARYHERVADLPLDPATAINMADPLIEIMDDAALEEVRVTDEQTWAEVVEKSAEHAQHAATLYRIVETYWPERLKEIGMMEPSARRVALLDALSETWRNHPPDYPVIVAGSTGTLKATARLMSVVSDLPKGMVVLPGLQKDLPERVWKAIDARHPQASMKSLLTVMGVDYRSVPNWPHIVGSSSGGAEARRKVLAEALVPVDSTGDWLDRIDNLITANGEDVFQYALEGLSLIEARTDAEEATAIALIMREALETEGRTAALVTPDQLLAQRVQARLTRWNVAVDMSQGVPLLQTSLGIFLSGLLDLAQDWDDPVNLSLIFNHTLCTLDREPGEVRREWQALEKKVYRGPRPKGETPALVSELHTALAPLLELDRHATPDLWASALIAASEQVASTDETRGTFRVWQGDTGLQASTILDGIVAHGGSLPETDAEGFARLMGSLMRGSVVRPTRSPHPRLSILGPLEARLLDADVIILGGLNEGTWPASVQSGPFLSRGMRKAMKLSLPERRYGLAAHDFAELAANPTVYLTRSEKDESGPTVASRWVWRLKTLLRGALPDGRVEELLGSGQQYLDWARAVDVPDTFAPLTERPNPKPPVEKRWARKGGRKVSITGVSRWIRDPYSLFGKEVLRLDKLDPLDAPLDARHFGTAMHKGIEDYLNAVEASHDVSNQPQLEALMTRALSDEGYAEEEVRKEKARVKAVAIDLLNWFAERHAAGFDIVGVEANTRHEIKELEFTVTGKLDLVEESPQGYAFTDFKTGNPPSANVVKSGFDVQLPLAGWLAAQGSVEKLPKGDTVEMGYIRLKGSKDDFKHTVITGEDDDNSPDILREQAISILRKLIERFDQKETGYPSQPRIQHTFDYGEYDDLARRDEWSSVIGEDT